MLFLYQDMLFTKLWHENYLGSHIVLSHCTSFELFFGAPAAAAYGEREKSTRALRWIDPETRSTDLDVLVCIVADRIPQVKLCSVVQPPTLTPSQHSFFLVFNDDD